MSAPFSASGQLPQVYESRPIVTGILGAGPLTQPDYEAMKRATRVWRDTLLLMFLRNTGFRPIEVARLESRQLGREGPTYYVQVQRAKKRVARWEPVFLSPVLGQPLVEWAQGQHRGPADPLWGIADRQLRNVVYGASERALGRRVEPKAFRRLYIRSVAEIAAQVLGWAPQHLQVAAQMVGHESVRTTWDWYFDLTAQERIRIQEAIPV